MSREQTAVLQRRFVLMTGKGGVGKTTVVAALAVHAASLGMRPLVVELGHRESMRSVFGVDDIGFKPKDVGLGVHAMSVDVDVAVLDYMLEHIPSKRVAKSIVNNKVLERLFAAMPAVGEIATINKLRQLEAEELPSGGRRWGPIIVDLDATGHALMFLELRNVIDNIMGAGPMKRLVEETADMLANPETTRLCLVATPAELPVTETIELYGKLQGRGTVSFGSVFANRVPQVPLGAEALPALDQLEHAAKAVGRADVVADVAHARIAMQQHADAQAQLARLRENVDLPIVELPLLPAARMDGASLGHLGALAAGGEA
ncbi:MAG: ArsA-related P-loop ATPase [Myxococcota bacterium]